MGSFGKRDLGGVIWGTPLQASTNPKGMRSGIIDWCLVPAAAEDTRFNDGIEVKAGEKCLRYGTILVLISGEKNTFAPYVVTAIDGRQKLEKGNAFILNETICEADSSSMPRFFDDGDVYKERLLVGEENQPSWKEFYAVFSSLRLITD